ncbi:ethanolamine ammonia-lyase heavy subunit [Klebsiella michiganensis]|uniref:Ethanolamine ammonia-lyase heavy subunit n=1 Tax=Klebsiella michiganensis TaxID=1134687 RepID=A0A7H4N6H8_9ENTR|nr:ethanolamine ammonia-lyase heavy subunit [Klebsiella michiganensis]
MLNYQSTSFHDALYARRLLGLQHAPEFADWLTKMQIIDRHGALRLTDARHPLAFRSCRKENRYESSRRLEPAA